MIDDYYFMILENTIKKWVASSVSVGEFAKSRSDFSTGLMLKILDDFAMIENGSIGHGDNSISFSNGATDYSIYVKTAPTSFEYPQSIKLTSDLDQATTLSLGKTIEDILNIYTKADNQKFKRTFLVFIVYPCTHNDKEWEPFFSRIKPFFKLLNQLHDFRFINNVPGSIYLGELNKRNDELDMLVKESSIYLPTLSIRNNEKQLTDIHTFKVNRQNIVENIRKEMIESDKTYSFDELQEIFELKYREELNSKYPNITTEEISELIKKFRSNGTGAKRAHLLLTTVNEKHRVHYRPNIKNNYTLYNLFYYINEEQHTKKRLVKALDLNDLRISDNIKVYYEKSASKNEDPIFETLGEVRRSHKN